MSTNTIRPAVKVSTDPVFNYRPFLGFGSPHDVADRGWDPEVRFVLGRDAAAYVDWQEDEHIVEQDIPHGERTIFQDTGSGPMTLDTAVLFRSRIDFQVFRSIRRSVGVLRMNYHFTMHEPDAIVTRFGHLYADFHNVVVKSITNQTFRNDGSVRCDVLFKRSAGAHSYYGAAYYAGDDE